MAVTPKVLYGPTALTGSAAALFTAGSLERFVVLQASVLNTDTSGRTFSIHVVRSGDAAVDGNLVMDEEPIAAHEALILTPLKGLVLEGGDAIHGFADTTSLVNIVLSGYQA